jgi:nitrogen fixation-related uncharacterized protein
MQLLINHWAIALHDWIIVVFYKEALAAFFVYCLMLFVLAAMLIKWALDSGQFRDIEASKFEMLLD